MYLQEYQEQVGGGGGERELIQPNAPVNTKVRPDAGRIAVLLLPIVLCCVCFAVTIRVAVLMGLKELSLFDAVA